MRYLTFYFAVNNLLPTFSHIIYEIYAKAFHCAKIGFAMKKPHLLNRNEVAYGPSPSVAKAIRQFDVRMSPFYFDGYYGSLLLPELAKKFKLPFERVSIGYGIEFFLRSIFDECASHKDIILTNDLHYGYYSAYAEAKHIRLVTFGLIDRGNRFEFDIDDCLAKIKKIKPRIVLITSPNNPTGNSIGPPDLAKVLHATKTARKDALVVLDEAYRGFKKKDDERAMLALLNRFDNLVILRGFSKRFALAGLRIGFALWGKRAKATIRFDNLYLGGSRLLEEIAVAAIRSEPYYRKLSKWIIAEREQFIARVNRLQNFTPYHSDANFVLVKIRKPAIVPFKKRIAPLKVQISKFITPQFLRVSIGFHKDIVQFMKILESIDEKMR